MLADGYHDIRVGGFSRDIHKPSTYKLELVSFIAQELPVWRDHPDRPNAMSETLLTEHLCDHLNSATCNSAAWSHVQFRTETSDEVKGGRKIDLAIKPRGYVLYIEGRRHTQFTSLFPIECKRLPTPKAVDRDLREYVFTGAGSTGGIQRFKCGHHGSLHDFAAMIAYIQENVPKHWIKQVNAWIYSLTESDSSLWSKSDLLNFVSEDPHVRVCRLQSRHSRTAGLGECMLHHLWVQMY